MSTFTGADVEAILAAQRLSAARGGVFVAVRGHPTLLVDNRGLIKDIGDLDADGFARTGTIAASELSVTWNRGAAAP